MPLVLEVQAPIREWVEEALPLFEEHYKEIATYQDIPLSPNYDNYVKLGEAGKLVIITAKMDDDLVGYIIYMVDTSPHYSTCLTAVQDVFFVKKGPRKSLLGIGAALLIKSEEVLKDMGVQVVMQHVKVKHDFSPFLSRLGYEQTEKIYQKRIG